MLVAPLLGRARIFCARAVFDRIRDFELPINWPETGSSDAALSDWVNQFRKARILVPAGTDEATAIRRAYAGAVKPAAIHGTETRIVRNPVAAHDAVGALDAADLPRIANENFVLSTNLIALAINDDEVIALHPTGSLTHMTTLLWRIAQLFGGGCRVSDAMASLKTFDGCDEHQFLRAVDFLARKRLLWCDEESELQAGRAYAALHWERPAHLRVLFPWKDRWQQAFRPYDPSCFGRRRASAQVAFIGPCLAQQGIACMEYLAELRGLKLGAEGFLYPGPLLRQNTWNLVYASSSPFAATFFTAISTENFAAAAVEIPAIVAEVDRHIDEIRSHTSAPIALVRPSRSGLSGFSPAASARHAEIQLIGQLAAKLELLARDHRDLMFIDEDDIALGFNGTYWDDEYNATIHHAPLTPFNWADLSVGRPADPISNEKPDPAAAMAAVVLDLLEVLVAPELGARDPHRAELAAVVRKPRRSS